MHPGPSRSIIVLIAVAALAFCAADSLAQQPPAIEIAFPSQLVRGQTNTVHIAIPSHEMFTGAEISPSTGISVARVVNVKPAELSQNVAWWDVTIDVGKDATPGPRSLVLVMPGGRSTAAPMIVPGHVPAISGVKLTASDARTVAVEFVAADETGDLGDQPYVWFTIACGGEPTVGVVRGTRAGSAVRASIPRPGSSACTVELRASDAQKFDSNTVKARLP